MNEERLLEEQELAKDKIKALNIGTNYSCFGRTVLSRRTRCTKMHSIDL
jgi:hypothetical protein